MSKKIEMIGCNASGNGRHGIFVGSADIDFTARDTTAVGNGGDGFHIMVSPVDLGVPNLPPEVLQEVIQMVGTMKAEAPSKIEEVVHGKISKWVPTLQATADLVSKLLGMG